MSIGAGVSSVGSTASNSTVTTTGVATQATGSTFVVGIIWEASATFSSITDSKGNDANYVQIGTEIQNASSRCRLYYVQNGTGGAAHTATVNVTLAGPMSIFFQEVTGGVTTPGTILDQNAQQAGDSSSPYTSTATATTSQANELIFGFFVGTSGSNPATHAVSGSTPAAGSWTLTQEVLDGTTLFTGCIAYALVLATGAYESGFTESGAVAGDVFVATFKEAPAAPPPPPPPLPISGNKLFVYP